MSVAFSNVSIRRSRKMNESRLIGVIFWEGELSGVNSGGLTPYSRGLTPRWMRLLSPLNQLRIIVEILLLLLCTIYGGAYRIVLIISFCKYCMRSAQNYFNIITFVQVECTVKVHLCTKFFESLLEDIDLCQLEAT